MRFYSQNASNVFFRPQRWRNLKPQKSPVILDLCLRKPQISGKSREYRDTIVFEKLCFQTGVFCPHKNEKPAFSNSSSLKSVLEKLRFVTD